MSTDRELLELAAKAANYEIERWDCWGFAQTKERERWNPLSDDGDALRLAVKLRLVCGFVEPNCWAELPGQFPSYEACEPDPYAATRRAIVRAAAEIGRTTLAAPQAGSRSSGST